MYAEETRRNTGSPSGDRGRDQLATRERWAGPCGVAERLAVPAKPGNSGGGVQAFSGSVSALRVWLGPVTTPDCLPSVGESVSLFREPDAGNLPVRFDEREQETEPSQTGLR